MLKGFGEYDLAARVGGALPAQHLQRNELKYTYLKFNNLSLRQLEVGLISWTRFPYPER